VFHLNANIPPTGHHDGSPEPGWIGQLPTVTGMVRGPLIADGGDVDDLAGGA
jgi:hypothetical protein